MIAVSSSGRPPVFCSRMVCDALVVATMRGAKTRVLGAAVNSGPTPMPEIGICAKMPPSAVKVMKPVRSPAPSGAKVTVTVQEACGASVAGQLVVKGNSVVLVPAMVKWVSESLLPVLVTVNVWPVAVVPTAVMLKLSLGSEKLMPGGMAVAVMATTPRLKLVAPFCWGRTLSGRSRWRLRVAARRRWTRLPPALAPAPTVPDTRTLPVISPSVTGVTVICRLQLSPLANEAPQSLVSPYSPLGVIRRLERLSPVLLVRVAAWGWLVTPTTWVPKLSTGGVRVSPPGAPKPCSDTDCVPPSALSLTVSVPVRLPSAVGAKRTLKVQWAPG